MTDHRPALGRPWRRTVALVIARDPDCKLKLEGCTGRSETANHKIPRSQGGSDHPDQLEGACHHCNRKQSDNPHPTTDQDRHSRSWT